MACLTACGATNEVGGLCKACALRVPKPDDLITEQVWSNADEAEAWMVDGFGAPHRIGAVTVVGRDTDHDLVVLTRSVSREHAELKKTPTGWTIRDLGSRNSTFVDNVKTQGRVALPARCQIRVGDVSFWFLQSVAEQPSASETPETQELANNVLCMNLEAPRAMLRAVGNNDPGTGGSLMSKAHDATEWASHNLSPIEFQLMRLLFVRALAEADSPSPVRGCVPTRQLIKELPWQSEYPDENNVRAVVKRLRKTLSEAGANGILDNEPGRGYYFSCPVTMG